MLTYKDLLLTGPEAVCVLGVKLEIRECNQLARLLLGYRNKGLVGRRLSDIVYDDLLIRQLMTAQNRSGWSQGECTLKTSSGLPLMAKFRAGPVMDDGLSHVHHGAAEPQSAPPSGQTVGNKGYVLVFREADESEHSSCEFWLDPLRVLLDAVSDRDASPEDILQDFAETLERHAKAVLLPPDFAESQGKVDQLQLSKLELEAAQEALSGRTTVLHYDDSLWCFFPVLSLGKVYGLACIRFTVPRFYDEADRKLFSLAGTLLGAYMETQESNFGGQPLQLLLHAILNGTDQPIVVLDEKGLVTLCNTASQRLYGFAESDMVQKPFGDLVFPADAPVRCEDLLRRAMNGETIRNEDMSHVRADWTTLDVSVSAYPNTLDDGTIIGAILAVCDLREKKQLWSKMMQWEKLSALGELLSSVANELNNPLTSLTGYSQLLLYRENNEDIDDMVSIIYDEAKRCSNVVRSVLDLARGREMQRGDSNVNDIIIAALNLKRSQLMAKNIEIRTNLSEDLDATTADAYDVERLFLRIINYAEQRMVEYDDGGQLTVESALDGKNIVVRFADTGTCVLKDDVAEILDPFFIGSGEDESVGLGFSISCQILRNIGGSIRVDNQIGKGNIFTVELPAMEQSSANILELKQESVLSAPQTGKRIMVVDDEPAIVSMLAEMLQQMGHITDVASDGNEAMNKLNSGTYDLIIADLRMPSGFTGDKLHKFIELKDPELARRIIFMTGDVINPETQKFLQSTGNPYLEKPFLLGSLRETIHRLLSEKRSAD